MDKVLGQALKMERENHGISIEEIVREMHIQKRYVLAMENEDFSVLPNEFYSKYYIKCYLKAVRADEKAFFFQYKDHLDRLFQSSAPASPQIERSIENVHFRKFRKRKFLIYIPLIMIFIALAIFVFAKPITRTLNPSPGEGELGLLPSSNLPLALPGEDAEPDFSPVNVSIDVLDTCWIKAEKGNVNIGERTYLKGEKLEVGGYRLLFIIGNPQAVRMKINGREYESLSKQEEPQRVLITPQNIEDIFSVQ